MSLLLVHCFFVGNLSLVVAVGPVAGVAVEPVVDMELIACKIEPNVDSTDRSVVHIVVELVDDVRRPAVGSAGRVVDIGTQLVVDFVD